MQRVAKYTPSFFVSLAFFIEVPSFQNIFDFGKMGTKKAPEGYLNPLGAFILGPSGKSIS